MLRPGKCPRALLGSDFQLHLSLATCNCSIWPLCTSNQGLSRCYTSAEHIHLVSLPWLCFLTLQIIKYNFPISVLAMPYIYIYSAFWCYIMHCFISCTCPWHSHTCIVFQAFVSALLSPLTAQFLQLHSFANTVRWDSWTASIEMQIPEFHYVIRRAQGCESESISLICNRKERDET